MEKSYTVLVFKIKVNIICLFVKINKMSLIIVEGYEVPTYVLIKYPALILRSLFTKIK